ncbi:MAG: hypothetical protein ABI628_04690 [Chloroflexota bacterium]
MNHVGWFVPDGVARLAELADLAIGLSLEAVVAHEALAAPYVRYYARGRAILGEQLAQSGGGRAEVLKALEAALLDSYATDQDPAATPRRGAAWFGEALVPLLDGWVNGRPGSLILGTRNAGRVAWLPDAAVVEAPVRISAPRRLESCEPVAPPALARALLSLHAAYEGLAVEAVLVRGQAAARRALMANPMVLDADIAADLLAAIRQAPAT